MRISDKVFKASKELRADSDYVYLRVKERIQQMPTSQFDSLLGRILKDADEDDEEIKD